MTAPDTRDSVELLPCPGCGGAAQLRRDHGRDASKTWIECSRCPIRTASRGWLGGDASIVDALASAWNRRALPQQAGGEDYSALKTRLRDSAMLSTLPEWGRKELEQGADAIAALQAEVARLLIRIETLRSTADRATVRADDAEAALREARAVGKEYNDLILHMNAGGDFHEFMAALNGGQQD